MPEFNESVDLKVALNDQAAAAFDKLCAAMEKVAASEQKIERQTRSLAAAEEGLQKKREQFAKDRAAEAERNRRQPTAGENLRGVAGVGRDLVAGGGAFGAIGKAGAVGAAAALSYQAVDAGLGKMADAANIVHNTMLTEAQKRSELLTEFVPLYGSFKRLREALDGTTEGIAESNRRLAQDAAQAEAVLYKWSKEFELKGQAVGPQETARAYERMGGVNAPRLPGFDRSTSVGQQKYQEFLSTYEQGEAVRRAGIRAAASGEAARRLRNPADEAAQALKVREGLERDARQRENRVRADQNANPSENNKLRLVEAINDVQTATNNKLKAAELSEQQIVRLREAELKHAQDVAEQDKARVEYAKAALAVEEQREGRMAGRARSVGGMTDVEYAMAEAITAEVKDNPDAIRNLPPELRGQVGKIAPEFLQKQEEKIGEERLKGSAGGALRGIDDATINEFRNRTIQEVRARVDAMRADIRVQIDVNEEHLAARVSKILEAAFGRMLVVINAKVAAIEDKIKDAQRAGFASRG